MDADVTGRAARVEALSAEVARLRQQLAEAEQRAAHLAVLAAGEQHGADAAFLRSVLASSGDCIKDLDLDLDAKLLFMTEIGQRVMEVSDFNAIRGCPGRISGWTRATWMPRPQSRPQKPGAPGTSGSRPTRWQRAPRSRHACHDKAVRDGGAGRPDQRADRRHVGGRYTETSFHPH